MPTKLYHLTERVRCRFDAEDVFIGHPFFPHADGGYGVTEMAVHAAVRPRMLALISPLHCNLSVKNPHINEDYLRALDLLMPNTDRLFAIMGEYWWNEWDASPFSHWKDKMVRLDMAVDSAKYPFIKEAFNKPGRRGYLYIGSSSDPRKGIGYLSELMSRLKGFPRAWIGDGPEIPHMKRISTGRPLDPAFMREVAREYDIFVSPSIADPNPTTILESMAWGFSAVCTPQSGYYETDYLTNIPADDADAGVKVLLQLQEEDESRLAERARMGREAVESRYSWGIFTDTVVKELGL